MSPAQSAVSICVRVAPIGSCSTASANRVQVGQFAGDDDQLRPGRPRTSPQGRCNASGSQPNFAWRRARRAEIHDGADAISAHRFKLQARSRGLCVCVRESHVLRRARTVTGGSSRPTESCSCVEPNALAAEAERTRLAAVDGHGARELYAAARDEFKAQSFELGFGGQACPTVAGREFGLSQLGSS